MGKEIKLAAKGFGIKFVRELLCFFNVTEGRKRVVIHLIGNTILIKNMLHHFPSVDVNLDQKREPGLKLYMHKTKVFIKIIKVIILALAVDKAEIKQAVFLFDRLKSLTGLHHG